MQYQPNTLRRSSQRTFITLEYQNYGKLCVTWFVRVFGFLQQVGLTFVPWHRGSFFVGKIFINARILQDPFLVGIPLIRVIRGAQDVSLYIHAWRPSKATSDLSKVYLSPSASFRQLLILSMHSGCLVQESLISRRTYQPWDETVNFMVSLFTNAQAKLSGSIGPSALPRVYQTLRITLITTNASTSMTVDGS